MRLALLLAVWYATSLLTSITTKEILRPFPYPITLAAIQQAFAATCGWASLRVDAAERSRMLRDTRLHASTLPVAAVMVIALIAYRWSLMSVSVAFTHTIKTLGPVCTIAFSRILLGESISPGRALAVLPVVLGVALTSITEAEFALVGFCASLISTAGQACQVWPPACARAAHGPYGLLRLAPACGRRLCALPRAFSSLVRVRACVRAWRGAA